MLCFYLAKAPAPTTFTRSFNASIAARACCDNIACDIEEITTRYKGVLAGNAAAIATANAEGPAMRAERLRILTANSASLQEQVAVVCLKRAETCIKQCTNAMAIEKGDATGPQINKRACLKHKKTGEDLQAQAEASAESSASFGANGSAQSAQPDREPSSDSASGE